VTEYLAAHIVPDGFQGRRIPVPGADRLKPNRDFLAERYALFRRAS
jgi:hypothetical protein